MQSSAHVAPNQLSPTARRQLIWLGIIAGISVFVVGTAVFAFLLNADSAQSPPGTEQTSAHISAPDGPNPGAQTVAVRAGGEFIQAVVTGTDAAGNFDQTKGTVTFNPLFALAPGAQTAVHLLFPRLLDLDPVSGLPVPTGLAQSWSLSEDGRVYTFTLRTDMQWGDGTPVTAADFLFTYGALARPETQSPYQALANWIEALAAPDPHTLVVTLTAPNCGALHSLRHPLLPSHRYAADYSDLGTNPLNQTPEISAGPFEFVAHTPQVEIVLGRNANYAGDAPALDRYVLQAVADDATAAARLVAGEVDLVPVRPAASGAITLDTTVDTARVIWHPQPGYSFLAANLADPRTPQPAFDVDGAPIPQTAHPILGDLQVRTALALAIDADALVERVGGYVLAGYLLPTIPWANPSPSSPLVHDPGQAAQLLEDAGWTLAPGERVRRQGETRLALRLTTNEDNPRRVALAHALAENLRAVGVDVRLEPLAFERMTAELLEQGFDLTLAGWDNLAPDPGLHPFWHSREDIPGRGFNFASFQDTQVDGWLDGAWGLPGCDPAERGALYAQVQARVQEELPWLVLVGDYEGWAVRHEWQNIAPGPWQLHYNVAEWGRAVD